MSAPNCILVASDLSLQGETAIARALVLARSTNRQLWALNVIADEPLWWFIKTNELDPDQLRQKQLQEALTRLNEQMDKLAEKLGADNVPHHSTTASGKAFIEIIRHARRHDCGLIVVGAHGRHQIRDWFIGTTAERVVRKSDRPVLVAKRLSGAPYDHVSVAVDFSDASRKAVEVARALAPRARFTLIHAYEIWFESRFSESGISEAAYNQLKQEKENKLFREMTAFAQSCDLIGHDVDIKVVTGHPGTTVVDVARQAGSDLVACGTHGMSGMQYVLLGSVAQHILRESDCDVLTVREGAGQFELP